MDNGKQEDANTGPCQLDVQSKSTEHFLQLERIMHVNPNKI